MHPTTKVIIPTAVLGLMWLFIVIALGLPEWRKLKVEGGGITITAKMGLFKTCVSGAGTDQCRSNFEGDCGGNDECTSGRSKLRGSIAMMFFAFFAITGAVVLNALNALGIRKQDAHKLMMIGSIMCFVCAFFDFLAFVIFATIKAPEIAGETMPLSSSFGLAVFAFIVVAGVGIFLWLEHKKALNNPAPGANAGQQPPPQQGYPPQQAPPQQGYPPQQPPPQQGYPPQQPPPQQGYPPQQPPPQQGYPPQQPPPQQGYPPQQPPPQQQYAPGQGYPQGGGQV